MPTSVSVPLPRRNLRAALTALAVLLAWLSVASTARGDGDPASDILLGSPVFYPYSNPVSPARQRDLESVLARLRARGLNLKVAIIASPADLGSVPALFGRPQAYATFLEEEISFNQPQPLLVVMSDGFGVAAGVPAAPLAGLRVDSSHRSDGLARSALLAVVRIARATGRPVSAAGPPRSGAAGGGGTSALAFAAPAVAVLLAVLAMALVRSRLSRREAEAGAEKRADGG